MSCAGPFVRGAGQSGRLPQTRFFPRLFGMHEVANRVRVREADSAPRYS